jgi:hypothetical protein
MNLTLCLIILGVIIILGFSRVVSRLDRVLSALHFIIDALAEIYKVLNPKESADLDALQRLKEATRKLEAEALTKTIEESEANGKRH